MTEQQAQEILHTILKHEHLTRIYPPITLHIKNQNQGHANLETHYLSVPKWALTPYYYGIWYVVHEIAHQITTFKYGDVGHNREYKRTENRLLKLFGLTIKRNKAYPKSIYYQGQEVFHR